MKWEKFRKQVKKELNEYESPVDIHSVWKNIEPKINLLNQENKRRNRFFIAFPIVGVLLLASISTYWSFTSFDFSNTSLFSQEKNKTIEATQAITTDTEETRKEASTSSQKTISLKEDEAKENQKIETKSNRNNAPLDLYSSQKNKTTAIKENVPISKSSDKIYKLAIQNEKTETINTAPTTQRNAEVSSLNSSDENVFLAKNSTQKRLLVVDLLTPFPVNFQKEDTFIWQKDSLLNAMHVLPTKPLHKAFSLGIELLGGIGYAHKTLSDKTNGNDSLLLLRKNSEALLETSQIGLQFTLTHQSGFTFSSGIQRTTIAERLNYTNTLIETEMVEGIIHYRTNLAGELEAIQGMIPLTRTMLTQKKIYNRYEMYDIPLLIGYQQILGKWRIGGQVGVFANLSLKTRGQVLQNDSTSLDIGANQASIFKSKVGLSYQLGLSLSRNILPNLELNFSPTLRYLPNDFTVREYGVSQKYFLINARLGLRYTFGKR
jgi:hypothetical protein